MGNILSHLQAFDFIIVAAYLVILIGIGYWVSFVKKKNENENLFLAEHSLSWPTIGLNMWGTNVGPSMLLASASAGYVSGIASGNFAWYAFIFILIPFFIVNGILTGSGIDEQVVWYNNNENLGIRFLTIPVEDFGYAFSLILFNLLLRNKLKMMSDETQ